MKKYNPIIILYIALLSFAWGQNAPDANMTYVLEEDISYFKTDAYSKERCVLDVYYPKNTKDLPTLVYFHGGGLKRGNKYIPDYLKEKELIIVSVNYRFYPKVNTKQVLDDAAKAVKWVFDHIENYGGTKEKIVLSGHSAGGYIASMLGLDASYLTPYQLAPENLAAIIPLSGHTITHMTVREEMGIGRTTPIIDTMAPLYHIKKETPPYIMITGDRELELLGRYEENAYMMRMMRVVGNTNTTLIELEGYGHGMVYPAAPILLRKIKEICAPKE